MIVEKQKLNKPEDIFEIIDQMIANPQKFYSLLTDAQREEESESRYDVDIMIVEEADLDKNKESLNELYQLMKDHYQWKESAFRWTVGEVFSNKSDVSKGYMKYLEYSYQIDSENIVKLKQLKSGISIGIRNMPLAYGVGCNTKSIESASSLKELVDDLLNDEPANKNITKKYKSDVYSSEYDNANFIHLFSRYVYEWDNTEVMGHLFSLDSKYLNKEYNKLKSLLTDLYGGSKEYNIGYGTDTFLNQWVIGSRNLYLYYLQASGDGDMEFQILLVASDEKWIDIDIDSELDEDDFDDE